MKTRHSRRYERPLPGRDLRKRILGDAFVDLATSRAHYPSRGRRLCQQIDRDVAAVQEHDQVAEALCTSQVVWSTDPSYGALYTTATTNITTPWRAYTPLYTGDWTYTQLRPLPPPDWQGSIQIVGNYLPQYIGGDTNVPISTAGEQTWTGWAGTQTPTLSPPRWLLDERDRSWEQMLNLQTTAGFPAYPRVSPPTPEQEMFYRDQEQRRREAQERWQLAKVRARSLLESVLADDQRRDLEHHGRFYVRGSRGRRYCINAMGHAGNVDWVDEQGRILGRLCAHPVGVPDEDAWITQMLTISTDEDLFVRTANVHAGQRPELLAVA